MAFEWTAHRFTSGLLALDLVNTVVCRSDPARRADRFDDVENIDGFAEAAMRFRAAETGGVYFGPCAKEDQAALLALREAVNDWARPQAKGQRDSGNGLARLFEAAAQCSKDDGRGQSGTLARAAAVSAMRLFDPDILARTKICPNCDWLFVDQSKNRSRLWCDMAVCGNRAKARAHYRRSRAPAGLGEGAA